MRTDPRLTDALVRFGSCARTAARMAAEAPGAGAKRRRLASMIKALAWFFRLTVG